MVNDYQIEQRSVGAKSLQSFFSPFALRDLRGDLTLSEGSLEGQPVVSVVLNQQYPKLY
jgi:hypothetical protein